ncbi:MAG: TIGR03000 domain-containing protein [Planctomycetia bacterium]|nr:TIGR03000 domain-containing protein [Planctomycetia bacterium]
MPAYYAPIVPGIPILDPVRVDGSYKNVLPTPSASLAQRATVSIRLPADARLSVDGVPLELTGADRVFTTPELPIARDYTYNFKIEYDRNGRTLSESQKVSVTAGKTSTVVFEDLTASIGKPAPAAVTAKPSEPIKPTRTEEPVNPFRTNGLASAATPARISIKLPADTVLFIDGKKNEKIGNTREFTTPPIPFGKEFSYDLKLVKTRNGQPEELTQKVVFQAGETVTVDFTEPTLDRRVGK